MKTAASIWEKMTNGNLVIKGEEVPPHHHLVSYTLHPPLDPLGPPWTPLDRHGSQCECMMTMMILFCCYAGRCCEG